MWGILNPSWPFALWLSVQLIPIDKKDQSNSNGHFLSVYWYKKSLARKQIWPVFSLLPHTFICALVIGLQGWHGRPLFNVPSTWLCVHAFERCCQCRWCGHIAPKTSGSPFDWPWTIRGWWSASGHSKIKAEMRPPRISGELLLRRASRDRMLLVDTQRWLFSFARNVQSGMMGMAVMIVTIQDAIMSRLEVRTRT